MTGTFWRLLKWALFGVPTPCPHHLSLTRYLPHSLPETTVVVLSSLLPCSEVWYIRREYQGADISWLWSFNDIYAICVNVELSFASICVTMSFGIYEIFLFRGRRECPDLLMFLLLFLLMPVFLPCCCLWCFDSFATFFVVSVLVFAGAPRYGLRWGAFVFAVALALPFLLSLMVL